MWDTKTKKRLAWYAFFAAFTLVFGIVYEHFSHGVYSGYMMYAFVFPLAGVLLTAVPAVCGRELSKRSEDLLDVSVITWTLGFIVKGVLVIYGTTNGLSSWYFYAGTVLTVCFAASYIGDLAKGKR